eukprot:236747-Prymnesium_polylepis.1
MPGLHRGVSNVANGRVYFSRAEFCAVKCERRGGCPNHNLMGWAGQAYAEVLAGIGCKCACCLRLLDGYWFGWHEESGL